MNNLLSTNAALGGYVALVAASLLTGCAVGPNFKAPEAPHTAGFSPPGQSAGETTAVALPGGEAQRFVNGMDIPGQWWTLFQSPELNALIERALKNSPTLQAAQAALRQANEIAAAQRGSYYPSVSGTLQSERHKASGAAFGVPGFPSSYYYNLQTASVNVSYTLDAFGGTRRQVEALRAQAEYQAFALEASYLTLTSNIVASAINEASLRAQVSATEDIAGSQQRQLDITQRRLTAGGASRADVLQLQATLQSTLATLPALRSQLAQERNQLAAYVGALPADYTQAQFTLDSLKLPQDLPVSLPSKFVEQRPDVREYSALLHQATAQVGVATANMLPQITITASYGQDSPTFANLFSASSNVYGLIGSLTQPIFRGGQLLHQRRAAVAAAQEAAANYQATVITAFQNVSNTLYALQADADALAAQLTAERTAADSLALVQVQYKSGAASYVQVLTAQQSYQNSAVALVKARAQRFADTAALFQALGGGWWNRNEPLADNSTPAGSQQAHR
ncbi:MAG TPA: efflux transporter outer membrane subunit [Steroidobacteraceae bacterium]|jgi:NodT family efflux transporter outer membrane factor (OMF) lipoprotein|nr:efflux transporter outer membrane subunit [Steroidobacteraceae bacterium]